MSWSISSFLADSPVGQWIAPRASAKDALEEAIRAGDLQKCSAIIESDFNGVDHVNELGDSYLHQAAFHGHVEVVRMLIDVGADIHGKGRRGYTPLHFAALRGHHEVVDCLLEHGADVRVKNATGKNCYEVARLPSMSQKLQPYLFRNPGGDASAVTSPAPVVGPAAGHAPATSPSTSIDYGNADGFGTSHYHDPTNPHYDPVYAQQHRAAVGSIAPPPTTGAGDHFAGGPPTTEYYQDGKTNVAANQKYVSYFGGPAPTTSPYTAPAAPPVATPPPTAGAGFAMPAATGAAFTTPQYGAPVPPTPPTATTPTPAPAPAAAPAAARGVTIFTPMAVTTHNSNA